MNQERREQIIKMVNENRMVKNSDLMERFDISIETVRRDLKFLEKLGYIQCVYGGAVIKGAGVNQADFKVNSAKNVQEKNAIGQAAAKLVDRGDTLYFEDGTTVMAMTQYLKDVVPITVVTNSLRIGMAMSGVLDCTVMLLGGQLQPGSLEMQGFQTEENLKMFNIDKAFIGATGITETHFTDNPTDTGYIRRRVINDSSQAIVLADHSKFGVRNALKFAAINELDIVVTDDGTPEKYVECLRNTGLEVVVAKVDRKV